MAKVEPEETRLQTFRGRLLEEFGRKKYFFLFCGILAVVCVGIVLASLPFAEHFAER